MDADITSEQVEIIEEFIQESRDLIDDLEPSIIELANIGEDEKEIPEPDTTQLNSIFRLFHSLAEPSALWPPHYHSRR